MPFRHLTIAKKGLLVVLLPLIYQVVLLGMLLKRQHNQAEAQALVVHTRDILNEAARVDHAMLAVQGSFLIYTITQSPVFEAESRAALKVAGPAIARLQELTEQSSPAQRQRVAKIAQIARDRIAWEEDALTAMAGNPEAGMERVRSLVGKRMMEEIGAEIAAFNDTALHLDEERLELLSLSTERQNRLLIGGLVLNVAIGVVAAVAFGLSISRRVQALAANARRLATGQTLVPSLRRSRDELGQLDVSFHEMAGGLIEARARESAAQAALERRNTDLEHVNRDLDHKNQENEMFVYSVSHDLRSPLVNLQGFSKELGLARDDLRMLFEQEWTAPVRQRAQKVVERDVSESIHYIQTAVMRLSSIIDALLRLSRAGRVDYLPEEVDLQVVVQRIATALRGSLTEKGATLTVGSLPPAWADPTALEQIFANLIGNAVNYLNPKRPGQIEIGFCAEPPPESAGMATWYVQDNGLGIAAAYLPKVFAIFQRLHEQAAKGEGVGLTLVRRMVERHGGLIWVHSTVGEGSTFYVALPTREASPLSVAPGRETATLPEITGKS